MSVDGGAWCRLLPMRSQRVGHDSATSLSLFTFKEKQPPLRPVPVVCVLGREGGARNERSTEETQAVPVEAPLDPPANSYHQVPDI